MFLIIGCQKEKIVERPTDNNPPLVEKDVNVIWQTPINTDKSILSSIEPIITDNGIIVSAYNWEDNEVVRKFDLSNGQMIWEWSDYININPGQKLRGVQSILISNDILVGSSQQDHYGINTITGLSEWSTLIDHRDQFISSFESTYFHTMSYGNNSISDSSTLNICNVFNGVCQEVIKFKKDGNFDPHIYGTATFKNTINDTIVIFQNRAYNRALNEIKVNYHCYNITQKRMEWEHLDAEIWDNSNIRAPLIDGDYCYFVGLASAYCFNIHTGEKIWQYDHDVAWQLSNYLIHENNFIIKDDQSNLLAINKNSGQLRWKNTDASACCVTMRLYGDRIYYCLLYTSPSPRDATLSRMPSSA